MNTQTPTLLDSAALPLIELAELARRESHRPRPVYLAHKWFARRFGTAMRALLVASQTTNVEQFWATFETGHPLQGKTVADVFIGGGSSLYEAARLGADVIGNDIDPVASAVTKFELSAHQLADPWVVFDDVSKRMEPQQRLYDTLGPDGERRIGLHYFWVQRVECGYCENVFDAHPTYRIAIDGAEQVAVCASCGDINRTGAHEDRFTCLCGRTTVIAEGPLTRGRLTCPGCGHQEALIDTARRTGSRPAFALFAIESVPDGRTTGRAVPIRERAFQRPHASDLEQLEEARVALQLSAPNSSDRHIPREGRSDDRLISYGYRSYRELFNDRQLLHLDRLLTVIGTLPEEHRLSYGLALSNHLTANCMLTRYTERWRQVTPLFALRAFAHSARPVELNPWLRGTGRGTFPNALRKVSNAIAYAKQPREHTSGGFADAPLPTNKRSVTVTTGDSRNLAHVEDNSVDIVLTDPPYMDNIDYSELADFFTPWLSAAGIIPDAGGPPAESLAAKGRGATHSNAFEAGLRQCFEEATRTLRSDGRMIFTFQHRSPRAWVALATALRATELVLVSVFPLRGDSDMSLHRHAGSSVWDAVFVLAKRADRPSRAHDVPIRSRADLDAAQRESHGWAVKLQLSRPDELNLQRALTVAAFLGPDPECVDHDGVELGVALAKAAPATA